jgi:hypothetical protein
MSTNAWSPSSWREKPIAQDVTYEDKAHLNRVLGKLRQLPPLVSAVEVSCSLLHVTFLLTIPRSTVSRSNSPMSLPARPSSSRVETVLSSLTTARR